MTVNGEAITEMFRVLHPDLAAIWEAEARQRMNGLQAHPMADPARVQNSILNQLAGGLSNIGWWPKV